MSNGKFLKLAVKRFDEAATAEKANRERALESDQFIAGKQWPDTVKSDRISDGRPCMVFNKLRKFINQVSGEIRQNTPAVEVRPNDSAADVLMAEVRQDLIRHIEEQSKASHAYKTAMESCLRGGWGYWRIITEYEDDSFDQDIKIKRITNRFSVHFDQAAQELTYEDARYCFISEEMGRDEFKKQYPKVTPGDFTKDATSGERLWFQDDSVRVAEYFYKEPTTRNLVQLDDGSVYEVTDKVTEEDIVNEVGLNVVNRRTAKSHKVMWCKITSNEVLEGPIEIPSKYIPVVPVIGLEEDEEGKRILSGLTYDAQDAQRMYNYWQSHATETVALAPKAPYLITPAQLDGFESSWKQSHIKNYAYLPYNYVSGQQKPSRERPPDIPAAALTQAQNAAADIQDTIGRYEASKGQPSNERSGRAILARQKASDATTYAFIDNFMEAIQYSGRILVDMIPRVFDTERVFRLRGEGATEQREIAINTVVNGDKIYDLSYGKYDVVITAGAAYQTKRQQIAASMLDFVQFVPMSAPILGPEIAKVMDWPKSDEIAEKLQGVIEQGGNQGGTGRSPTER